MKNRKIHYIIAIIITATVLSISGCNKQEEPEPVISEAVENIEEPEESKEPEEEEVEEPEKEETGDNLENESDTTEEEEVAEEESESDLGFEIIPMDDTVMYCIVGSANIRKGPSTDFEKAGSISYSQAITINGRVETADSTWYVIKTESSEDMQMVSGSLLSTTKPAPKSSGGGSGSGSPSGGGQQAPSGGGSSSSGGVEFDGAAWDGVETFDWGNMDTSWGGFGN